MIRSFDGDLLNSLVNHPEVRPDVGGDGKSWIDLRPIAEDDKNYILLGKAGGFCCTWSAPETYEVHTFILPEGRGPDAFQLARDGRDYMASIGAMHLWTRVLKTARHTRIFTLKAGFKHCGEQFLDLGVGPVLYDLFHWRA